MIDLPMAVWLLQDGYNSGAKDAPEGELISVTTLLKPTRQLILGRKTDRSDEDYDVSDMIASRMGHGLHDSIERAWTEGNWQHAMRTLHYPQEIIDRIRINPKDGTLKKDDIPIYLEKRGFRKFEDIILTGQLDFCVGAAYRDFKSTSVFSYMSGSKDMDYMLQGSMYRWIMQDIIKEDMMRIEFIFTDWQKFMSKQNPNYPQTRVTHKEFTLLSLKETEEWMSDKLADIRANAGKNQTEMVRCSDKELWRSDDTYKYYADSAKAKLAGRCTKRFTSPTEAELWKQSKGKGTVIKVPGEVKACEYCPAFSGCEQRKEYFSD